MSECLGRDISVRQHSKSEHWAPCHIQTPSRYDWKRLKATLSPNQTNQMGNSGNKNSHKNQYKSHLCKTFAQWGVLEKKQIILNRAQMPQIKHSLVWVVPIWTLPRCTRSCSNGYNPNSTVLYLGHLSTVRNNLQSTLVISNFTGPDKNVRVISSSRQPNCDVIGMTTVRLCSPKREWKAHVNGNLNNLRILQFALLLFVLGDAMVLLE